LIAPGLNGWDAYNATRPFAWYVFAGIDGQAVGFDETIDGEPFRSTPHVSRIPAIGEFQAGVAVMQASMLEALDRVTAELTSLSLVIVVGEARPTRLASISFESLDVDPSAYVDSGVTGGDLVAIMYTSGTTGPPKGVKMPHAQHFTNARQAIEAARITSDDCVFVCLPLYHNNALTVALSTVLNGGSTLALGKSFSASKFWDDIIRYDATAFVYIGEVCAYLLNQPEKDTDRKHKVRVIAGNGAPTGTPPYRIVANPYTLLDKSDLVFIDMPDSGFGRIFGSTKPFFGVDQDVAAFGQFIQRYLSQFNRWNSPKFLFGESYGTTRSAALADYLLKHGVALNGVVLLSSILNFGLDYGNGDPIGGGDWAYVFYLPTEAATAWYHDKAPNRPADFATFLGTVEQFALGQYLHALYAGDKLSASERNDVVAKLSRYLGLSQHYIRNSNLRVPYSRFQAELLRSQGRVIGRLDGRYTTYTTDVATTEGPPWDPTDSSIDAPFTTAINAYLRNDLQYNPPLEYRPNIYSIIGRSWDLAHNRRQPTNVAPDLADAMTQNPHLRVFSANGYYDFATPFFATVYTLKHLNLSPQLQNNITFGFYESGHMVYLSEPALAQFKSDLARFYDAAASS